MTQSTNNIRDALRGHPGAVELGRAAARYIENPDPAITKVLADLDVAAIAHSALLGGETLEAAGAAGPYASRAQRAAWAAGRVRAACEAIVFAEELLVERKKLGEREAKLHLALEASRVEARAYAKALPVTVPFREVKRRHDWSVA
jgi:hypothetical protein